MKEARKIEALADRDYELLNQAVMSLEQAEEKLEKSFNKKKPEQFNAVKQFILKLNKKIMENLE